MGNRSILRCLIVGFLASAGVGASADVASASAIVPRWVAAYPWPDEGVGYPGFGSTPAVAGVAAYGWPDEGVGYPGFESTPAAAGVAAYAWPDEGVGYPGSSTKSLEYNYPTYDPRYEVPTGQSATVTGASNGTGIEFAQTGVSAAGGAAIALGAMWVYRRRHAPAS